MRFLSLFLLSIIFSQSIALAIPVDFSYVTKKGTLEADEIWEGNILLLGDVTVPTDRTLTIKPDTVVYCAPDTSKSGQDPRKSELIVFGTLKAKGTLEKPILIAAEDENNSIILKPEKFGVEVFRKEWHAFKWQYGVVWAFISAIFLLR